MGTITGVNDASLEQWRKEMRCTGGAMSDDNDISMQRLQIQRGIFQRLAFH